MRVGEAEAAPPTRDRPKVRSVRGSFVRVVSCGVLVLLRVALGRATRLRSGGAARLPLGSGGDGGSCFRSCGSRLASGGLHFGVLLAQPRDGALELRNLRFQLCLVRLRGGGRCTACCDGALRGRDRAAFARALGTLFFEPTGRPTRFFGAGSGARRAETRVVFVGVRAIINPVTMWRYPLTIAWTRKRQGLQHHYSYDAAFISVATPSVRHAFSVPRPALGARRRSNIP